jgi:hypothetical protein
MFLTVNDFEIEGSEREKLLLQNLPATAVRQKVWSDAATHAF